MHELILTPYQKAFGGTCNQVGWISERDVWSRWWQEEVLESRKGGCDWLNWQSAYLLGRRATALSSDKIYLQARKVRHRITSKSFHNTTMFLVSYMNGRTILHTRQLMHLSYSKSSLLNALAKVPPQKKVTRLSYLIQVVGIDTLWCTSVCILIFFTSALILFLDISTVEYFLAKSFIDLVVNCT